MLVFPQGSEGLTEVFHNGRPRSWPPESHWAALSLLKDMPELLFYVERWSVWNNVNHPDCL